MKRVSSADHLSGKATVSSHMKRVSSADRLSGMASVSSHMKRVSSGDRLSDMASASSHVKRVSSGDRLSATLLDAEKTLPTTAASCLPPRPQLRGGLVLDVNMSTPSLVSEVRTGAKKIAVMAAFLRAYLLQGRAMPTPIARFAVNDLTCTAKDVMADMVVSALQLELMSVIFDAGIAAGWNGSASGLGPTQSVYYMVKAVSAIHGGH
jgi:hypothetical protein